MRISIEYLLHVLWVRLKRGFPIAFDRTDELKRFPRIYEGKLGKIEERMVSRQRLEIQM